MANKESLEKIREKIENYFNSLEGHDKFSGSILVSVGGEKVMSKGYGMANYELEVPNTADTKHRIGSVTKQFTAASILQLCEQGLISLEDTLDKYLPDFPKGDKVTIHHLLTHTSGIFNQTSAEDFFKNIRRKRSVEELIGEFKDMPYDFEPGEKHSYSNSGYILLGYIIEKITKKSYEQYLKDNIFSVLFMENSGMDSERNIIKNRASGYSIEGEERTLFNCDFIDMSIPYAAGALYSTVEDLHIWNKALTEGRVIGEETLKKMTKGHAYIGEEYGGYGYGIIENNVQLGGKTRRKVYHNGGIPGFVSSNYTYPEEDVQLIMITNTPDEHFHEKVGKVEGLIFEEI